MSNIIRHKRSNTLGAVPSYGEFTEGEILLNTRDGKAFFKKVMPGSEEIIEIRGTRDTVRPTGQTGEEVVSETGIRAAISSVVQDLIPNYFVTDLAGFIGAYNDIRGNYPGGNIYITGNIIMTGDLTLDLRGISITGLGANWRFYNGIELNPSQVFKMIITKGSPVFSGINFWGSNGASGLQLQNGTTRQVFVISPQVIDFTMSVMFRDCRFSDIICGTPGNPFVIDSPIGPSATIHLRFDGCNVNTHGSDMALTGFGIQYTSANSSGLISVDIRNQTPSLQSHKSLKFKVNSDYSNVVVFAFNSDETAWIDSDSDLANITRTNTVLQANPAPVVFSPSDSYLLMATGNEKNIVKVSAAAFAAGSGGGGGGLKLVGLSMPNIFNVSNSPLTANGTITTSLVSQLRSRFFASPPTADGVPTFRPITLYDLPILPYDKYDSWLICIPGLPEIEVGGVNSVTKYTGITMKAGTGIAIYSESSLSNGTLEVTIESTVKPALLNEIALTSNSSTLVANNWTTILELPVPETGIYQFNFHVSLSKVGTGAAHIAARLAVNGSAVIGSVETYTSGYKASLSGSGSFNFTSLARDKITLQVFTNTASWVAVATTVTSSSGKATQLSSLKIS